MLITTHSFGTLWCAYWYIGVNVLEECVASIFGNTTILNTDIISFISVDPYRIRNPNGYGKWSHNHRVYKTIKTIFVSLAPYKLFDTLR